MNLVKCSGPRALSLKGSRCYSQLESVSNVMSKASFSLGSRGRVRHHTSGICIFLCKHCLARIFKPFKVDQVDHQQVNKTAEAVLMTDRDPESRVYRDVIINSNGHSPSHGRLERTAIPFP